jgi:hypothetical protein
MLKDKSAGFPSDSIRSFEPTPMFQPRPEFAINRPPGWKPENLGNSENHPRP